MTHAHSPLPSPESTWSLLAQEALSLQKTEPFLSKAAKAITGASSAGEAICRLLAEELADCRINEDDLYSLFSGIHAQGPAFEDALLRDLTATRQHDPAARDIISIFLFYKGFHALQAHRIAHKLWNDGRHHIALHIQSRVSEVFSVDIHPGARIGAGVMMDHATGIVIGETAIVGNDVLFWHGVTLGGRGAQQGDRHPKIGNGVWLGAQSTVLGAIKVGDNARIAANSVVTADVAAGDTVAGAPAKSIRKN